jgi:hypothetical protein
MILSNLLLHSAFNANVVGDEHEDTLIQEELKKITLHLCKKGAALCWKWGSPIPKTLQVVHVTSLSYSQSPLTPHSPSVLLYILSPPHTLTYIRLSEGRVYRGIILRWIIGKWDVGARTGSRWLRIGTGGGNL